MSSKKKELLLINLLNTSRKGLIIHKHVTYPLIGLGINGTLTPFDWEVEIVDENYDYCSIHTSNGYYYRLFRAERVLNKRNASNTI